jgi:hypothetical protein
MSSNLRVLFILYFSFMRLYLLFGVMLRLWVLSVFGFWFVLVGVMGWNNFVLFGYFCVVIVFGGCFVIYIFVWILVVVLRIITIIS